MTKKKGKKHMPENINMPRRDFLTGMIGSGIIGAMTTNTANFLWEGLIDLANSLHDRISEASKQKMRELFDMNGRIFLSGSHVAPEDPSLRPKGACAFAHDIHAGSAFSHLFVGETQWLTAEQLDQQLDEAIGHDSFVMTGSPDTNLRIRDYLPIADQTQKKAGANTRLIRAEQLRYHFAPGLNPIVSLISMKTPGKVRNSKDHGIFDLTVGETRWPRHHLSGKLSSDESRWLETDFLLLTKLPRGHSQQGDVLILSGGHGAGTQSFELLLEHQSLGEVTKLAEEVSGNRYFQAVVETDVEHPEQGSIGRSVRLSKDFPVHPISLTNLFVS